MFNLGMRLIVMQVQLSISHAFVDLDHFVGVQQEYAMPGTLARVIQSLYSHSKSCDHILSTKPVPFPVQVGLYLSCPYSVILFMVFKDTFSRSSHGNESVYLGNPQGLNFALYRLCSWVDICKSRTSAFTGVVRSRVSHGFNESQLL